MLSDLLDDGFCPCSQRRVREDCWVSDAPGVLQVLPMWQEPQEPRYSISQSVSQSVTVARERFFNRVVKRGV